MDPTSFQSYPRQDTSRSAELYKEDGWDGSCAWERLEHFGVFEAEDHFTVTSARLPMKTKGEGFLCRSRSFLFKAGLK